MQSIPDQPADCCARESLSPSTGSVLGWRRRVRCEGKSILEIGYDIHAFAQDRSGSSDEGSIHFAQVGRVTSRDFIFQRVGPPGEHGHRSYDLVFVGPGNSYEREFPEQLSHFAREALIVETPILHNDLESGYIAPLCNYFPYFEILWFSDFDSDHATTRRKAVIAFARTRNALTGALYDRQPPVIEPAAFQVDPYRSTFWCDGFFNYVQSADPGAVLQKASALQVDSQAMTDPANHEASLAGWLYWLLYVKGFLEFRSSGEINDQNPYLRYLLDFFGPQGHDSGLRDVLADLNLAQARVQRRFDDFQRFWNAWQNKTVDLTVCDSVCDPICIISPSAPDEEKPVFAPGSSLPIYGGIDGHHRLFLARLFGLPRLPARVVSQPQGPSSDCLRG